MKRRLILLGPPGAGKGTLAGFLKSDLGLSHISSGQLLRQEIARRTPLGELVQSFIEKGQLAPDDVVVQFMRSILNAELIAKGFMLDGFPRSVPQAHALDAILSEHGVSIGAALYCDAPEAIIQERITGRRTCSKCGQIYHLRARAPRVAGKCDVCGGELMQRADDTAEVVHTRLHIYRRDTAPLRDFYERQGKLLNVDCAAELGELKAAAKAALNQ